jgi:hypothetical protein
MTLQAVKMCKLLGVENMAKVWILSQQIRGILILVYDQHTNQEFCMSLHMEMWALPSHRRESDVSVQLFWVLSLRYIWKLSFFTIDKFVSNIFTHSHKVPSRPELLQRKGITPRHTALDGTSLDGLSDCHRNLYLATNMHPAAFQTPIPASK